MKLNRDNTALHFLNDGDPIKFGILHKKGEDQMARNIFRWSIQSEFPKMRERYRNKIQYLSDPFIDAFERTRDRLKLDLMNDNISQTGTFIYSAHFEYLDT